MSISRRQAERAFADMALRGTKIISIDTVTNVNLKKGKTNPLWGRKVLKHSDHIQCSVFSNYKQNGHYNMVVREMDKAGMDPTEFKLGQRSWGHRVRGTPFVEHMGLTYLEVLYLKDNPLRTQPERVKFTVDGIEVDPKTLDGLRPIPRHRSGVERDVIPRDFRLTSILRIRVDGRVYGDPE